MQDGIFKYLYQVSECGDDSGKKALGQDTADCSSIITKLCPIYVPWTVKLRMTSDWGIAELSEAYLS